MGAIKPIKFYFTLILLVITGFAWATWNGYAFYNDKVEKNTDNNGSGSRTRYINRFHHK